MPGSSGTDNSFYVRSGGYVFHFNTNSAYGVWPVGYLNNSTTIYDGDGTIGNLFKLR